MPQPDDPAGVVSFAEARSIVSAHAAQAHPSRPAEAVPLLSSPGRVLASPILADRNQPPFDRSTRDGFAARASDWQGGAWLRIAGAVRAGQSADDLALQPGEAIEIMTGAPVPTGADCIAMVEHVEVAAGRARMAGRALRPGDNIVPEASEAGKGDLLLPPGTVLGAAEIAAAAACGYARVNVFPRPQVAILATGDELVEVADAPLRHQIRNSNSYALAAQVMADGGDPRRLPIVSDDLDALLDAIQSSRGPGSDRGSGEGCDLLLLSGGVSMGKYDLVEEALSSLGAEFFFTGVRIQPGKPVVFGRLPAADGRPAQYFFGLPGNPISTQLTFTLFARTLLRALCGATDLSTPFLQATLAAPAQAKSGLTRFLPACLMHPPAQRKHEPAAPLVSPVAWQGSGDQAAQARANCYLVVPADAPDLVAGSTVTILLR